MEEKEVLTPNFYGIEKRGWIKKFAKETFSVVRKNSKLKYFFYWKNSGFRQIIKVNHFYSYHRASEVSYFKKVFYLFSWFSF